MHLIDVIYYRKKKKKGNNYRVDWGKEPTLRTNAHNFLHGLCIPEHYASKCVKESNQDKKQCYSTNIYNTKQLIKK